MSAFDKLRAVDALKAQGWVDAPEAGPYMMRPPRALIERLAAQTFHVHEATDLQALADEGRDKSRA